MLNSYLQSNTNQIITMNNNQDQFQKNMYQVPAPPSGEAFDSQPVSVDAPFSQDGVTKKFDPIVQQEFERNEILTLFNKMTRNLELDASDLDTDRLAMVESPVKHPNIETLDQLSADQPERRIEHLRELIERAEKMGLFAKAYARLFEKNASQILNPTIDSTINQESQLGFEVFKRDDEALDPKHDPEISEIQFFLHNGDYFYKQESSVPSKSFTNKYEWTKGGALIPGGILKSSTYVNEQGVDIHRSEIISEAEAYNLMLAAKEHYRIVLTRIYGK
jgi:hypothetical protein